MTTQYPPDEGLTTSAQELDREADRMQPRTWRRREDIPLGVMFSTTVDLRARKFDTPSFQVVG